MAIDLNKLSSQQIKDFHRALERKFGVTFFDNTSVWFNLLKLLLNRIFNKSGVKSGVYERVNTVFSDIALRPCCIWQFILLPWQIGDQSVSGRSQVLTAIHECEHALRLREYPGRTAKWYGEYFSRDSFRALEEGAAQIVASEVWYWASGVFRPLDLEGYFCSNQSIDTARKVYDKRKRQVMEFGPGSASSEVSRFAIDELKGDL